MYLWTYVLIYNSYVHIYLFLSDGIHVPPNPHCKLSPSTCIYCPQVRPQPSPPGHAQGVEDGAGRVCRDPYWHIPNVPSAGPTLPPPAYYHIPASP